MNSRTVLLILLLGSSAFAFAQLARAQVPTAQAPTAQVLPEEGNAESKVVAIDATSQRKELQSLLDSARELAGFPGAILSITLPDGSALVVASGSDDREGKHPLTTDARMLAGSTGKTFYAALALQLVEAGKLDLDATLDRYLSNEPWFPRLRGASSMSVRNLMNHTSGIERYELDPRFLEAFRAEPFKKWSIAERIEFLLDRDPPFSPGEGWTYSDTNYILLGAILESLCEHALETEIAQRFLTPLKLNGIVAALSPRIPGLACGHAGDRDAFVTQDAVLDDARVLRFDPSFEWAGGGFATNAGDLARWCRALHGGDILDKKLRDAMQDGVPCPLGKGARYGLGAIHWRTRHGDAFGHSGFFPGYVSEMRYYPALDRAAAIQINTSDATQLRPLGALLDDAVDLD